MQKLQPENQILTTDEDEDRCLTCGALLEPVYENNGFNEPGAEHQEFIGYKKCTHNDE